MKYNKLVRDKIAEDIAKTGKTISYRVLTDEEYKTALEEKLDEEVIEFHESKSIEELADIIEVLNATIKANGYNRFKVFIARIKKKLSKGGFNKRVYLENVKEDDGIVVFTSDEETFESKGHPSPGVPFYLTYS